ncbi:DUF4244 domain-containing protein [Frankia sp. AgB1.9]|uniref:DUF4244 domain-containing protein n=1 Tax=unclassified Frankia TaxID=2632575 RepID=UPI001931E676|nr:MULTISPECIES: DUF4244 domain-containing protein [unclassified Frankia]MBL7493877.1 DUF4244 domain-containing protein [Frankia sp. AgW1.1]MBL7552324.1 DUF4244 domain-containing protein [Frankia sp. AgB1.9]MBL7622077.1 DUF4244 domain-containing protein [Frankia sp. AgB1.8]
MSLLPTVVSLAAMVAGCAVLAHGLARRPAEDRGAVPGRPGQLRRAARPGDAGMSTAEYAVGTVAAVAFAGVLYAVVSSSATHDLIMSVVRRALTLPF